MASYTGLYDKSAGKFGCTTATNYIDDNECSREKSVLLKEMLKDLVIASKHCLYRGLINSEKWMTEMIVSIYPYIEQEYEVDGYSIPDDRSLGKECYIYSMANSYFKLMEYDRAAYFTENCRHPIVRFLHLYSRYLSGEKKKNDDAVDPLTTNEQHNAPHLKDLHSELSLHYNQSKLAGTNECASLDGWQLWLYGVVLKRMDLQQQAIDVLCESIMQEPSHWGAWLELSSLITEKEMIESLKLPDHWMRKLFLAHIYLELHISEEALSIYYEFEKAGLRNSTYIKSQKALACHNQKDIDQAITLFKEIEEVDPFRLENVDMYSNLLFVKEMRVELAHLSHRVVNINKYRVETCCVVGNYYSIRGQHEKAVQYFQRALRLNPHYLAGWTLMGHEYMEMKNTNAAIQCYRQAIEVNRRDYRAWYGLGQTYEILKLPAYCIYYYKQAQRLHKNDSRTLIALGDNYEKLDKWEEAKKCYHKAHSIGDIEDLALLRLAKLYSQLNEHERAAVVYQRFLQETEENEPSEDRGQAYLFLAEHYLHKNILDVAYEYAHKCTLFAETKETGKTILNEIANKRQYGDQKSDDCNIILANIYQQKVNRDGASPSSSALPPLNLTFSP